MVRKHIAAALTIGVVALVSVAVARPAYAQAAGSLDPTFGTGALVARNVVFADPRVFEAFGLPGQISPGDLRPAR